MASNPIFSWIDTFLVIACLLVNPLYRLNICKLDLFQNNEKVKTVVKAFKNIPKRTIKKREDQLRFWKFFRAPHQSNFSITKWSLRAILLCINFQQMPRFAMATLISDKSFPNCNSLQFFWFVIVLSEFVIMRAAPIYDDGFLDL